MLEPETQEKLTVDDVEVIAAFFDEPTNDKAGHEFTERAFSLWVIGKNYTELLSAYADEHDNYLLDKAKRYTEDFVGEYDEEEYESFEEYEKLYNEELEDNCKLIAEKNGTVLTPCKGRLLFLSYDSSNNIF